MSLYIFDKDGTLVSKIFEIPKVKRTPLTPEEQVLIPGVFEKLAELRQAGNTLAIATNQSMVAEGLISLDEANRLVENCAAKVGGVAGWRLSPYGPRAPKKLHGKLNPYARDDISRKPNPGMILDLMQTLGFSASDTIMIGDSNKDRKAAEAAGVTFIRAKKFFKKKKKQK